MQKLYIHISVVLIVGYTPMPFLQRKGNKKLCSARILL